MHYTEIKYCNKYIPLSILKDKYGEIKEEINDKVINNIYIKKGYVFYYRNSKILIILRDIKYNIDIEKDIQESQIKTVEKYDIDLSYSVFIKRYKVLDLLDFFNIVAIVKPIAFKVSVINEIKFIGYKDLIHKAENLKYDIIKDVIFYNTSSYVKNVLTKFKFNNIIPDYNEILSEAGISIIEEDFLLDKEVVIE